MISYTLAKMLKDAGYPQEVHLGHPTASSKEESVYIPTLEELVAECSRTCDELDRVNLAWYPHLNKGCAWVRSNHMYEGESLLEAAAKLYIARNV